MIEIDKKINTAIATEDLDALLVIGVDNFTYVSHLILPFASNYPDRQAVVLHTKEGLGGIACPIDWEEAVRDQGWNGELVAYDENKDLPPKALIGTIKVLMARLGLEKAKIGIDETRASKQFIDNLKQIISDVEWIPFDSVLRDLRLLKTPQEVKLIESAAYQSELGIITALMHLEGTVAVPGYTINEFTERVRVHVFEFGGTGVEHMATQVGAAAQMFYTAQRGWIKEGDLARIDITNHLKGYWSNAGRMAVIGNPTHEQSAAFENNLRIKSVALATLKSGTKCNEAFAEVKKKAYELGIPFFEEAGIGHGVGVSHREAPFLNSLDETVLRPGMVIALDVYTYGPEKELIHSKDIYKITESSPTLLSWYKTWDKLYSVIGFRSTH
ncbi:MAG: M24 family metallopeptidase [Candidatus Bathyarchaeota archaeon]|jgi:Xaa-Pro dipeptidase|nr:M24 family metallopeptidase [Candidatus Bathyarchaeota archaeon]MDP7442975.1 M24 family metallopeptidase [Candidatus Bathyarchaeota archaeon]